MKKIGEFKIKKTVYSVYRAKDDNLELWHAIGGKDEKRNDGAAKRVGSDYDRIVTNVKIMEALPEFLKRRMITAGKTKEVKDPAQIIIE